MTKEDIDNVVTEIANLPTAEREILKLRIDGKSHSEIGEIRRTTSQSSWVGYKRAIKRIIDRLEENN